MPLAGRASLLEGASARWALIRGVDVDGARPADAPSSHRPEASRANRFRLLLCSRDQKLYRTSSVQTRGGCKDRSS